MKLATCFAVLALSGPSFAQPVAVAPWMTGAGLLALDAPVMPQDIAWQPGGVFATRKDVATYRERINHEHLQAYIEGVHDATEGKGWCWGQPYKPNPDVLVDLAMDGLRRLSPDQRKRNAAYLLPEIWGAKFPCKQRKP